MIVDVIPPIEIGITFDGVEDLESVKNTLKERVVY
jgi:hypothetical protein